MNKYSVMIVDDEEDAAEAIARKIDWESIGFFSPVLAKNGLEALDKAEISQPDVVMTDIQMPYMTGLELASQLRHLYPSIRIIIFSGFDEFEYAKEAIRLQAEEYILKPVDADEMRKVFERIRDSLDRELDARQNVKKLETYYMESLPLLQETFYMSLVEGAIPENELQKYLDDYRIDLNERYYAAAVLHISESCRPEGISMMLLNVSVRKLAEERLGKKYDTKFFSYLGNTVAIAQFSDSDQIKQFTDECDRFCRLAAGLCKAVVTIGIGQLCSELTELPVSYRGARDAVSSRVLYGRGQAINISEVMPEEIGPAVSVNKTGLHEIFKSIRMKDEDSTRAAAENYFSGELSRVRTVGEYNFVTSDIAGEIYRFAESCSLSPEEVFEGEDDIYAAVKQMSRDEMKNWAVECCIRMQRIINERRTDNNRSFVAKAVDYVKEHYDDPELNVDSICAYLGVSSAYFSTMFKRETGKAFTTYLTDIRMNKAVELLIEEDEKTYVIARRVGYTDPNYFSYVFKKQFGMSPSKYKAGKN